MNKLINILNQDGQLVVTSRQVADDFGKNHRDVLKSVDELINQMEGAKNFADLFIESQYQHEQNKQTYREYLLTRDGFSLLVMGFTGAKALQWKLKYIEAFNKMEQSLKEVSSPYSGLSKEVQAIFILDRRTQEIEEKVDNLENNMPLFNVDCKELQTLVRKKGVAILGGKGSQSYKDNSIRGKVYSDIQQQLRREFQVTRYEAIKRSQFEVAKSIVEGYKAPLALVDEIVRTNSQMEFEAMSEVACTR